MRLSLSLSSLLPSFFRALSNHHKRRRENDDDSLSFLSLSLEEEEEAFCERALLVCVVPDRCVLRLSLFVTLNYNTLNQWVLKSARDTFLFVTHSSRPRRAEADRKSPEKDDDVNDDDDNNAKNDSRKSEALFALLLLPPATSRGGGVPPSVFFFVKIVATRNASH